MLTYSEALTLLKSGEDMRCNTWPSGHFVRLAHWPITPPPGWHAQQYVPTQPEQLGIEWSKA